MEIDCKGRLEQNCELDPNCRRLFEKGKYKRCQHRNGVNGGLR